MKRRLGARVGLAVGTFPRPGGGRCPVLIPSTCVFCVWGGGGWDPPMGVCARCRGYRPPLGAGTKCPVASPPRHNGPPGAVRPIAPAGVGEGAQGSEVPIRTPSGPHCPYNRTCGPRRPRRGGGVRGGGSGGRCSRLEGGRGSNRKPAGPAALLVHGGEQGVLGSPPRVLRSPTRFLGPPPGGRWPPPPGSCATVSGGHGGVGMGVGKGHSRP